MKERQGIRSGAAGRLLLVQPGSTTSLAPTARGTSQHLHETYAEHGDRSFALTLAAYNAGQGNVSEWLADDDRRPSVGEIAFEETRSYVRGVLEVEVEPADACPCLAKRYGEFGDRRTRQTGSGPVPPFRRDGPLESTNPLPPGWLPAEQLGRDALVLRAFDPRVAVGVVSSGHE
jgi:hypothetical protein